jgi:hypothetical protein
LNLEKQAMEEHNDINDMIISSVFETHSKEEEEKWKKSNEFDLKVLIHEKGNCRFSKAHIVMFTQAIKCVVLIIQDKIIIYKQEEDTNGKIVQAIRDNKTLEAEILGMRIID